MTHSTYLRYLTSATRYAVALAVTATGLIAQATTTPAAQPAGALDPLAIPAPTGESDRVVSSTPSARKW